jgi:hypothetical protein
MQPRTTAVLFLVAAALAAFVYFYEIRGGEARKEAEARAKRLFPEVAEEQLEAIELRTTDARAVRLERGEGVWRLVEPIAFPVDEVSVGGMASSLVELASEGVIEEPQPAQAYGLDNEERVVRFRADGREHVLRIGEPSPVGGATYVATQDLSQVFTVPTFRVSVFRKSLDDLREKRLLRFERDAVERIEARWPGGRVVLQKEGEDWTLVEPLEAPADRSTVDTLLSDLTFLRASGFLDEPDETSRAALEDPALEVALELRPDADEAPRIRRELAIGGILPGGERVARSGEQQVVYTLPAERLEDFPRKVVAYRYKTLAEFAVAAAKRLELVFPVAGADRNELVTIVAERGESGWTSAGEPILPGKATRMVSEIGRLEAEDIAADSMGDEELAALALSPPNVILRVYGAPPEEGAEVPRLAEIHLGRADPERGIAAVAAGSDIVYLLDYALAEHIPISLEAFRNRFASQEAPDDGNEVGTEGAPAPGDQTGTSNDS